jgi:hypothetical protein
MVRVFECFNIEVIKEILADIEENDEKEIIGIEAGRSLDIISGR